MILLAFECGLGDEHGEVGVVHAEGGDGLVEEGLQLTPDEVAPGTQDVAARDVVVLEEFGLRDDLGIPLRGVLILLRLQPEPTQQRTADPEKR